MGVCASLSAVSQTRHATFVRATSEPSSKRFVHRSSSNVRDFYDLDAAKVGQGTFGTVHRGVHKATGVVRAVKVVPVTRRAAGASGFQREVSIMKALDHPNVVRLCETFEDTQNTYLAMELCQGGELFDQLVALGRFSERQAAVVMRDVARAVVHMHGRGVVHRDLKPENFLFATRQPIEQNMLKVIDFGTARRCGSTTVMRSVVGTSLYAAPEVFARNYFRTCDLWSCGVILFTLLSGKPPFAGKNDQEIRHKVRAGKYSLEGEEWASASEDAKRLLRKLLSMNARSRYSAQQALDHVWIRRAAGPAGSRPPLAAGGQAEQLDRPQAENKLPQATTEAIAPQLTEVQVSSLRGLFSAMDSAGDGLLTLGELRQGIAGSDVGEGVCSDLDCVLEGIGVELNVAIDYNALLDASLDQNPDRSFNEDASFGDLEWEESRHVLGKESL